jgi:membrane-bound serine protease (ClpP class)
MRRKIVSWLLLGWFVCFILLPVGVGQAQSGQRQVLVLEFDGPVTPVLVNYVANAISRAEMQEMELIVLRLNTPGGQIGLMNQVVTLIRESKVPVVVYVSPKGAMAASAGTLVTLAGHASAMAPDTVIGAASPVGAEGEDLNETMKAKVSETLMAQARSLAERRGEQAVIMAEAAVRDARAFSAQEALQAGFVDRIANDLDDLLRQLDDFSVQVDGETRLLHTTNLQVVEMPLNPLERLLQLLTDPNLVFVLLSLGIQAIFIELSSPGGWVAGFVGVVCVALAIYGMGILPVNWFGIVFLVIAFVLFVLDIKAPTHGALTAAGVGAFIAGSLILFNSVRVPGVPRISIPLVIGMGMFLALTFSVVVGFAVRAMRIPPRMGERTLVWQRGVVKETLARRGTVRLAGELWSAELMDDEGETAQPGEMVEVVAVEGVRLRVRKVK